MRFGDAYKPPQAFAPQVENGLIPRGRWAQSNRPLPNPQIAFLSVEDVMKVALRTGYRGWCSVEVFDGGPEGSQVRADPWGNRVAMRWWLMSE